jgi:hypothetical protein
MDELTGTALAARPEADTRLREGDGTEAYPEDRVRQNLVFAFDWYTI